MNTYLTVFVVSGLLAMVATPIVIHLARVFGLVDKPGVRKVHRRAIPRVGGVAIFVTTLIVIAPVMLLPNPIGDEFRKEQEKLVALLCGAALIFFVGLADDVLGLRANTKLLAQIVAAMILVQSGALIDSIGIGDWGPVRFGWLAYPITVLWIVGITNAVNLIDGLDGLAAGIAATACAVIAALAIRTETAVMAVLMLTLLGSLGGFLVYNFNPAKVFMGDCGSLFVGYVLAGSSVLTVSKSATIVGLALPLLALGVPIFDMLFSMLRRFVQRRSLFAPDRGHIHHRLLEMGLVHRSAVLVLYLINAAVAGIGMFMLFTHNADTLVVFGGALLVLLLVFRVVGAVRLRESLASIQRNFALAREASEHKRAFEHAQLRMREARCFEGWWDAVCGAAHDLGFEWLALEVSNRDGAIRTLVWRKDDAPAIPHETFSINIPVRHRRSGRPLVLQAGVLVDGSLESAGRCGVLLGRLIDEHSVADLPPAEAVAGSRGRRRAESASAAPDGASILANTSPQV